MADAIPSDRQLRNSSTHSDPWRHRCPECRSTVIERNNPKSNRSTATTQYRCDICSATFDDPLDMKE